MPIAVVFLWEWGLSDFLVKLRKNQIIDMESICKGAVSKMKGFEWFLIMGDF